jgi:hypothetical protein
VSAFVVQAGPSRESRHSKTEYTPVDIQASVRGPLIGGFVSNDVS